MNKFSAFLELNNRDFLKSIQVVVASTVIPAVVVILDSGRFPTFDEWQRIGIMAGTAWLGYIAKNWLTNSSDEFFQLEKQSDVNAE